MANTSLQKLYIIKIQEVEDIIRKYFQCWLDKDIATIKEILDDDIIYSERYGPVYNGIEQII